MAEKKVYAKKVARRADLILDKSSVPPEDDQPEEVKSADLSSESDETEYDSDGEPIHYVPRWKMSIFTKDTTAEIRHKKADLLKLTKGSDPAIKDKLEFLLDESRVCPIFLPMNPDDTQVTKAATMAASFNEAIPLSEYIRKEFYHDCVEAFRRAISADAGLMKIEIQNGMNRFDELYALDKTPEE